MNEPVPDILPVETIKDGDQTLAVFIRASTQRDRTEFVTAPDQSMQVGFVAYGKGGEIARHFHKPVERALTGTAEVLVVQKGAAEIDVYNDAKELVATRRVSQGDTIVLAAGGHGLRMTEDTVFLEVKQGPYVGVDEKVFF